MEKCDKPGGASWDVLLKLRGTISRETAEEWMRIIDETCSQIDDEILPQFPDNSNSKCRDDRGLQPAILKAQLRPPEPRLHASVARSRFPVHAQELSCHKR